VPEVLIVNTRYQQRLFNLWLRFFPVKYANSIYIARGSVLGKNMEVGFGTRFNGPTYIRGTGKLKIGRYCAIAHMSRFITSNHRISGVNLQHALDRAMEIAPGVSSKSNIALGHNVWLGDSVLVLPGVNVGNGAIIGAGSVVVKDIEPYSIYAGNPAKKVRDRFDDRIKNALEEAAWWEWSLGRMRRAQQFFMADFATLEVDEAVAKIQEQALQSDQDVT